MTIKEKGNFLRPYLQFFCLLGFHSNVSGLLEAKTCSESEFNKQQDLDSSSEKSICYQQILQDSGYVSPANHHLPITEPTQEIIGKCSDIL